MAAEDGERRSSARSSCVAVATDWATAALERERDLSVATVRAKVGCSYLKASEKNGCLWGECFEPSKSWHRRPRKFAESTRCLQSKNYLRITKTVVRGSTWLLHLSSTCLRTAKIR